MLMITPAFFVAQYCLKLQFCKHIDVTCTFWIIEYTNSRDTIELSEQSFSIMKKYAFAKGRHTRFHIYYFYYLHWFSAI